MRLGHYRARAEREPMADSALLCEAADGIRTHDLLHGKQRRRLRRLTTEDVFACVQAHIRVTRMYPDAWQHRDVRATTGPRNPTSGTLE